MSTELQTILVLITLSALSGTYIWYRFRDGSLFTPSGGLHVQIFIFFCLGGISFLIFSSVEPNLNEYEIWHYSLATVFPFLLGYAISLITEYVLDHRGRKTRRSLVFAMPDYALLVTGLVGSAGFILQEFVPITLFTYLALFFFPALLLGIAGWRHSGWLGRVVTTLLLCYAAYASFYSPWRSMLVIVVATVFLGVSVTRVKWLPAVCAAGVLVVLYVVPFQLIKRENITEFDRDPTSVVLQSLTVSFDDRIPMIGEFIARRMTYVRELIYVVRAIDEGFELRKGETYVHILDQLIPRAIWPEKPELAEWAGFDLPRLIGLLQSVDEGTSWAVNMFAEAAYNFGTWSMVWFVPVVFLCARGLAWPLRKWYRNPHAATLASVAAFYLMLVTTTVIFMASMIVALLVLVKVFDLLLPNPTTNDLKFARLQAAPPVGSRVQTH